MVVTNFAKLDLDQSKATKSFSPGKTNRYFHIVGIRGKGNCE